MLIGQLLCVYVVLGVGRVGASVVTPAPPLKGYEKKLRRVQCHAGDILVVDPRVMEDERPCRPRTAIPPACTGSWTTGCCCPRPPSASTPAASSGPTRSGSGVERLNLDAASFRQLERKHGGDGDAVRAEVLDIVATRGKMQNPVTGSGGMLIGIVEEVGPDSTARPVASGDRVATLVSLTLTPLVDRPTGWPAGTATASRCPPTATRSCSVAPSPPCCPTTCPTTSRSR